MIGSEIADPLVGSIEFLQGRAISTQNPFNYESVLMETISQCWAYV